MIVLENVREYAEGYPVELRWNEEHDRPVLRAYNEGTCNWVEIDLGDLLRAFLPFLSLTLTVNAEELKGGGSEHLDDPADSG